MCSENPVCGEVQEPFKQPCILHFQLGRQHNPTSQSAGAKGLFSHVRFLGPIAPVVYGCGDAHHQCGEAVAAQIVVLFAGVLALKDLHQHQIELHTLETHPGEGSQEEEMQKASKDGTGDLRAAGRERAEKMRMKILG